MYLLLIILHTIKLHAHIDIFKICKIDNTYSAHPVLMKVIVSSMYHFQKVRVSKDRKSLSQLTITSKGYYHKIILHNTYKKVENWTMHLT